MQYTIALTHTHTQKKRTETDKMYVALVCLSLCTCCLIHTEKLTSLLVVPSSLVRVCVHLDANWCLIAIQMR